MNRGKIEKHLEFFAVGIQLVVSYAFGFGVLLFVFFLLHRLMHYLETL